MVLLHGIGHDRHAWDPVVGLLAPQRELVLVDLPGHGDSPLPDTAVPGVRELTDVVERFLVESGLDHPIVVGNSLGGAIALELARRGRVRAVLALAPIGFWSRPEIGYVVAVLRGSRALARMLRPVLPRLLRIPAMRAAALGLYFAKPLRLSADAAVRTVRGFADAPGVPAILPHSRHYRFPDDADADLVPITIAWGAKDRLLIGGQAGRARTRVPGALHVRIPGSGHVPMSDNPHRIADLILDL
ncbi:alpha/beta fold hydrolase [Actinophytocola sp. NPDC049390]|uniref:alpha/beta fold hydrolase n=1 Tax=Actinophytocola sp. NPDC049390 TaxID=3363894 RepID=UPI00379D003B